MKSWEDLILYLNNIFDDKVEFDDEIECDGFKHTKSFCKKNNLDFKKILSYVNFRDNVKCDCSLLENSPRFINPKQQMDEKPDIDTSIFWNDLFNYLIIKNNAIPHPAIVGEYRFKNHERLKYTNEFCKMHKLNTDQIINTLKLTYVVNPGPNCDCDVINSAMRFFDPFTPIGSMPTIYPYDENIFKACGMKPPSRFPTID